MRVLVCHNKYQVPGGEDVVADAESALLAEHGHDVHRWTVTNDVIRDAGPVGKAAVAAGTIWSVSSYREMRRRLRELRPDVAHFHNTFPLLSPSVYFACRAEGVPVVQTLHNYRLLCPAGTFFRDGKICEECLGPLGPWAGVRHGCYRGSRMQTAVVAAMVSTHRLLGTYRDQVDAYIALTNFGRQRMVESGLPEDRVLVKPNSAPFPFRPTPHDSCFALYVGRLSPEKGVSTLLTAWQSLPRSIPLRVVGDGPMREIAAQQAAALAHVSFEGPRGRDEVSELMARATLLVFPSEWYEGLSLVVLEALAHGLPVVGSDLAALDDAMPEGETAWRFRTGDPKHLADMVRSAWHNRRERERRSRNAMALHKTRFSPQQSLAALEGIYDRVARRRPPHSDRAP